ncbi:MAG: hypothetical protein NC926_11475 [Candidatus Omnitrophica bacterium]|nr:hypothetical protein [Candidatus Omnitrophota bacterium]
MKVKSLVFILILLIIFSISFAGWFGKPHLPVGVSWGGGITYGREHILQ